MATREEVLAAAEKVAAQRNRFMALGMANTTGLSLEDRVVLDARYMVEQDHLWRLEKEYQRALRSCPDLST